MKGSHRWENQNKPLRKNMEWLRIRSEIMTRDLKEQKELYSKLLQDYNWMGMKHHQEILELKAEAESQFNVFQNQIKEKHSQNDERKKAELLLGKELLQGPFVDFMAQMKKPTTTTTTTTENSLGDDERKQLHFRGSRDDHRIEPKRNHHEKIQTTGGEEQQSLDQDIEESLLADKQNDSRVPQGVLFEEFVETLKTPPPLCITQQKSLMKVVACIMTCLICCAVATKTWNS